MIASCCCCCLALCTAALAQDRREGLYLFVNDLLDELVIHKDIAPMLALTRAQAPNREDPRQLLHFLRVAGWIEELQKRLPEFGHLVFMGVMYKLAFKLAICDEPWLPLGRIITPTFATVEYKWLKWHQKADDTWELYWSCICCTREFKPTKRARAHSMLGQVQRSLQLSNGEDPETAAFTEGACARRRTRPLLRRAGWRSACGWRSALGRVPCAP
jgi:hypothetical protein